METSLPSKSGRSVCPVAKNKYYCCIIVIVSYCYIKTIFCCIIIIVSYCCRRRRLAPLGVRRSAAAPSLNRRWRRGLQHSLSRIMFVIVSHHIRHCIASYSSLYRIIFVIVLHHIRHCVTAYSSLCYSIFVIVLHHVCRCIASYYYHDGRSVYSPRSPAAPSAPL